MSKNKDTLYTYFRIDLKDIPIEWDYTICESIKHVYHQLGYLDIHLDDDTIEAKVIITGIAMTKAEFKQWNIDHQLPERLQLPSAPMPYTHVGGMRWVSFHERKPTKSGYYHVNFLHREEGGFWFYDPNDARYSWELHNGIRWLDESPLHRESHVGEDGFLEWLIDECVAATKNNTMRVGHWQGYEDCVFNVKNKYLSLRPQPKESAEARRNIPEDMDDWCEAHQAYYKGECPECASLPDTNVGDISQQAGNQSSAEKDNPIASFCKGYETAHKQNRDQISSLTSERDDAQKNSDEWQAQYRVMAEVCKTRQAENTNLERNISKLTDEALEISIERDTYRILVDWMAKAYQTGQLATSALEAMLEEVLKRYPSNQLK
jgi:hypothetical protein